MQKDFSDSEDESELRQQTQWRVGGSLGRVWAL